MKIPLNDLHSVLQNCKLVVSVGEASDSKCAGKLTVVIVDADGKGNSKSIIRPVSNLGKNMQDVVFDETPGTDRIHHVIATLILDTDEIKTDDELIKFC